MWLPGGRVYCLQSSISHRQRRIACRVDARFCDLPGARRVWRSSGVRSATAAVAAITSARLRYLTLRWANELKKNPRIRLHSSLEPGQTWGLAVVSIDGIDSDKLVTHLWDKYRIVITAVGHNNLRDSKLSYRCG